MAILRGFAIAFFLLAMILFPQTVFAAAGKGLSIWWQAVVPSLFPFLSQQNFYYVPVWRKP